MFLAQEQLEIVQQERAAVLQRCLVLQADNQLLRTLLQEEHPSKWSHLAPPNAKPSQVTVQVARKSCQGRRQTVT